MPHRLLLSIVGLLTVVSAACSDEMPPSDCLVERFRIEGSPLTLLPGARLDRIPGGFVLLGTDGNDGDKVRWAKLGADGVIGAEHELVVPAHAGKPWIAVAGVAAPADHLIVAYIPAGASTTGMVDMMTISTALDESSAPAPVLSGQVPAIAQIAMGSGRAGMHAALTWGVAGTTTIVARILGGDGRAIGTDLMLANVGNFNCLRFLPGKGDLTIGYADLSATPLSPNFVGHEINASGMLQSPFTLHIGNQTPGCVELVPTETGYGLAWHSDKIGTFFGVYEPAVSQFPSQPVLDDVRVPAKDRPVVLGGLGWMGKEYAVVFARPTGAEVWPIDVRGNRKGTLPVFPSAAGHTGTLSTQPVDKVLYSTYADYASEEPTNTSSGVRFLVKISCP